MNQKILLITSVISLSASIMMCGCTEKVSQANEREAIAVKTIEVGPASATGGRTYSGTIEEFSGTDLSFSVNGTLQNLRVGVGSPVHKGQLIATIDDATLKHTFDIDKASLRQAQDSYDRLKILHDAGSLPEAQWIEAQSKLDQAQAALKISEKNFNDSRLYSTVNGVVAMKYVEQGQNVMAGMPIVQIVDINQVKVKIAVPENEVASMRPGTALLFAIDALGGVTNQAYVSEIATVANPATRTYDVKALAQNPSGHIKPGMICKVKAENNSENANTILVPAHIVQIDSDNQPFVWIARNSLAHKQMVTVGNYTAKGVEILTGLNEGDKVIVEGQQKVSENMKVKLGDENGKE